jgi:hypothetical protein
MSLRDLGASVGAWVFRLVGVGLTVAGLYGLHWLVHRIPRASEWCPLSRFEEGARPRVPRFPKVAGPPRDWWREEYAALLARLDAAPDRTLSVSYASGPKGEEFVRIKINRGGRGEVVLTNDGPGKTVRHWSEDGTDLGHEQGRVVTVFRDVDADGALDEFRMNVPDWGGGTIEPEEFTPDGFMRFRECEVHESMQLLWQIGMGFSVNHFLHGSDSVWPRD